MIPEAKPRIASYAVFRKDGKIAFVLRQNTAWMNGYYGLPSGKVDQGESFSQAVIREAKEEVGVDLLPENLTCSLIGNRNDPDSLWVDAIFTINKWDGELINAEPQIHSELAWLDPQNLPDNIVPSVRHYIDCLEKRIGYTEYGWDA
jgi:8-oxo-dGTP diphosphatase